MNRHPDITMNLRGVGPAAGLRARALGSASVSDALKFGRFVAAEPPIAVGMGLVYHARDPLTGESVAVKVLDGGGRAERFEREIAIARALDHPRLAAHIDHGSAADGRRYLVTEWVEGASLDELIRKRGFTIAEAVDIAIGIATGLAEVHREGLVHRDLKPSNVMVAAGAEDRPRSESIKLIDFGLALSESSSLTSAGTVLGTVGYMAPEQARGESAISPASDVFALGCILYLCVAGAHAFEGEDEQATQAKIVYHWPQPLRSKNANTPEELEALVSRFLSKKSSERPRDGATALSELIGLKRSVPLEDSARHKLGVEPEWRTASLEKSAVRADAATLDDPRASDPMFPLPTLPAKLGERYRRIEEIGVGGLGRVYRARDKHLDRDVAIKELLHRSPIAVARFRREAMVTARLEHPGIVPVSDFGRWPDGSPFYAMKLVSGETLKELVEQTDNAADRLALLPKMLTVCEAMAYAHDHDIIHRDLKPSNVVLGEFGETVIIDWGLARDLRSSEPERDDDVVSLGEPFRTPANRRDGGNDLTRVGDVLGTPSFMPPEQASGRAADRRSDVYSLGAMLYYMLSARSPHEGISTTAVSELEVHTPKSLDELAPDAPAELVAVVNKAMSRDSDHRYEDAGQLARELQRFLTGQLVRAHQYSTSDMALRFVRRHRRALVATAAVATLGLVFGAMSISRIVAAEQDASKQRDVAEKASAAAALENRRLRVLQAEQALDRDPTATLAWLKFTGDVPPDLRDRGVRAATDAVSRGVARHVFRMNGAVNSLESSGRILAATSAGGDVAVWHADSGAARLTASIDAPGGGRFVALSKDGSQLAVASSLGVHWWPTLTSPVTMIALEGATHVRFLADNRLAVATEDGALVLLSRGDVVARHQLHKGAINQLAVSEGRIATAGSDGNVGLLVNGQIQSIKAHAGAAVHVEFLADEIVSAGLDASLRVWRVADGARVGEWTAKAPLFAFQLQGNRAVLTGNSSSVELWSRDRAELDRVEVHDVPGWAALSAELWVAGVGSEVVVHHARGARQVLWGHQEQVDQVELLGGGVIATSDQGGEVRVWTLPVSADRVVTIDGLSTGPARLGSAVVVGDAHGQVWRIAETPTSLATLGAKVAKLASSGSVLAVATADRRVHVIRSPDGGAAASVTQMDGDLNAHRLAISSDGARVAGFDLDGRLLVWNAESGALMDELETTPLGGYIAFQGDELHVASPDGAHRVVTGHAAPLAVADRGVETAFPMSFDRADGITAIGSRDDLRLFNNDGGEIARHPISFVHELRFTADDDLVAASGDGLVHVFDRSGGHRTLLGHRSWVRGLDVAAGRVVSISHHERGVWWWNPRRGLRGVFHGQETVLGAVFDASGDRVAIADGSGAVSIFSVFNQAGSAPSDIQLLQSWLDVQTTANITSTRTLQSLLR